MYAIVEIAGQQFKVEEGKKIFVHRLEAAEGETVQFDKVLLVEDEGKILVGEPVVQDYIVEGEILNDKIRGDKVIVFKKKRKKGYRVKNGHRQNFTQIEILHIGGKDAPRKERVKKEPAAEIQNEEVPVEETKSPAKKVSTRKSTAKKAEETEKKPAKVKATVKKPAAKEKTTKKTSKSKE
jgi:large subunit ribosomal protein L21